MVELHSIIEVCPHVFAAVCLLKQNKKLWICKIGYSKEDSSHGCSLMLLWITKSFSLVYLKWDAFKPSAEKKYMIQ